MALIEFKNLPDTSTPLSAENLNNNFNELNNRGIYSTEEKVVGTWIDGKPIYRKVVIHTYNKEDDNKYPKFPTGITNLAQITDISYILHYDNKYFRGEGIRHYYNTSDGHMVLIEPDLSGTIYFTIEYTKTPD